MIIGDFIFVFIKQILRNLFKQKKGKDKSKDVEIEEK